MQSLRRPGMPSTMDPTKPSLLERLPPFILHKVVLFILPIRLSIGGISRKMTTTTRCPENPLLSLILAVPSRRGLLDTLLFGTCRFEFNGYFVGIYLYRSSSKVATSFFNRLGISKIYLLKWLQLNPGSSQTGWANYIEHTDMLDLLGLLTKSPRLGHHRTELLSFSEITPASVISSRLPLQPLYYGLQEFVRPRLIVPIRPRLRDEKGRFIRSRKLPLDELHRVLHRHIQKVYPVDFTTELPLELRRIIYSHLMSDAPTRCEVTEQGIMGFGQNNGFASYLRINQDVYYELSELLYRNCLFHFQHATNARNWNRANKVKDTAPWCADFLNSIGKDKSSNIRNVRIELTISEHHPHYTPPIDLLMNEILMACGLEFRVEPQYLEYTGSTVQAHTSIFLIDLGKLTRGHLEFQVRTPWTWDHTVPFSRSGRLQIDVAMKVLDAALCGLDCAVTTQGRVTTRGQTR